MGTVQGEVQLARGGIDPVGEPLAKPLQNRIRILLPQQA